MRLIDADKLLDLIYNEIPANRVDDYVMGLAKAEEIALSMYFDKSVEAIPIDWIVKYLHELDKQADEEADFIINELGGYDTFYMMEYAIGIRKMLEKWEKENEAD